MASSASTGSNKSFTLAATSTKQVNNMSATQSPTPMEDASRLPADPRTLTGELLLTAVAKHSVNGLAREIKKQHSDVRGFSSTNLAREVHEALGERAHATGQTFEDVKEAFFPRKSGKKRNPMTPELVPVDTEETADEEVDAEQDLVNGSKMQELATVCSQAL